LRVALIFTGAIASGTAGVLRTPMAFARHTPFFFFRVYAAY
jgi:hypothetical protein